jgi:hypothetical protein
MARFFKFVHLGAECLYTADFRQAVFSEIELVRGLVYAFEGKDENPIVGVSFYYPSLVL